MPLFYPKKIAETKLITRDMSIIVFWLGFLLLIPMVVGLLYGEPSWWMYLPLLLITSGPPYLFMRFIKKTDQPFTRMTLITLAVSWICFSVVGSYPFIFIGSMHPLDGYFESVSAVSTTGMTMIEHPESFPQSIIFWRAMLSWLGGLGITAFAFYSLMQYESISKIVLGEGYGRLKPSIVNSAVEVLKIYSFWTVTGIVILVAIGIPIFDSFNLSMNAVSTTGFDVRTGGWEYYRNNMPQAFPVMSTVVAFLMLMGAMSVVVHYRVIKNRRLRLYLQDPETVAYLVIIIVGILLVATFMLLRGQPGIPEMAYEVIGASTGGYEMSTEATVGASGFVIAILVILVVVGGSSNGAAGGIKVGRVDLLFKYVLWKVNQQISPSGTVSHFKHNGKPVDTGGIITAAVYAFVYCTAIALVSAFMTSFDYDAAESALTVASVQAGAGMSPIPGWELVWPVKVALIGTMLFGRLEFIPLFALGIYALKRR
jgi:trk system potassium uptake protein TrkH